MKFCPFLIGFIFLMGCSRVVHDPSVAVMPDEIVLGGGSTSFSVNADRLESWSVSAVDDWIVASPARGVGSQVVKISIDGNSPSFQNALKSESELVGSILVSGDASKEITVRLPIVDVSGRANYVSKTEFPVVSSTAPKEWNTQIPNELLVRFRVPIKDVLLPDDVKIVSVDAETGIAKVFAKNALLATRQFQLDPTVSWVEENGMVHALAEPTDHYYPRQWHLKLTGARFQSQQTFSKPVTVAVLDTGVRYDHPDLTGRLVQPAEGAFDFTDGDSDPTDPYDAGNPSSGSHGTHVAGLIAANEGTFAEPCAGCSTSGVVGTAYSAPIKVLPLRVLDTYGDGTYESVTLALRYAAGFPVTVGAQTIQLALPVEVISLSLGGPSSSPPASICGAVKDAVDKGILVVAAIGNSHSQVVDDFFYPAACDGAIGVASVDYLGNVSYFSMQNSAVDISAPGGNMNNDDNLDGFPDGIFSTTWNYDTDTPNYSYIQGTSQATPQVSAALAMLISAGKASSQTAFELLASTATDLGAAGRDNVFGAGAINLVQALGWSIPASTSLLAKFDGPIHRVSAVVGSTFSTRLIPGVYSLTICRDDNEDLQCQEGEPSSVHKVNIPAVKTFDVGEFALSP